MKFQHADFDAFRKRFSILSQSFSKKCKYADDFRSLRYEIDNVYNQLDEVSKDEFHKAIELNEKIYEKKKELSETVFDFSRGITVDEADHEWNTKQNQINIEAECEWNSVLNETERRLTIIENDFVSACKSFLLD